MFEYIHMYVSMVFTDITCMYGYVYTVYCTQYTIQYTYVSILYIKIACKHIV